MKRSSGGAVPGAGSSKAGLHCIVKLLDGSSLQLDVNKKAPALSTYEQVLRQLSILEREFFAFEYEDDQKNMQWVDLQKPLKKQIKKLPMKVNFRVKYYPLDPMVPHASCRNHFYQQLRKDIVDGTLKCPNQEAPSVLSYVLQADLGDFESVEKDVEHIVDNGLLLQECTDLQEEVANFHRLYKGMNVLDAVVGFLRKVRDLETYGVQLYNTRYEDTPCELGITPGGISVFRRNRRIVFHDWEVVTEVSFKNKKLIIVLIYPGKSDTTVTLEMESLKVCKDVWKICADFASFYSEPGRRVREEPETLRSPGAQSSSEKFTYPLPQSSPQRSPQCSPGKQHSASSLDQPTAQQKTKSLPHKLPSHDPITAALIAHGSPDGIAPDTPTTPGDFTSLSNSNSDQNLSPLTPSSLGGGVGSGVNPDSAMDLILPGIPNLRDEDGLPLKHPSQQQTTPPQIKTTPPLKQHQVENDQPYRYKSYKDHIKDTSPVLPRGQGHEKLELSHMPENDHFARHNEGGHMTDGAPPVGHATDVVNGDMQPPSLPPRNYRSQYRSEFHSKGSTPQQQQQAGVQQVSPPSPLGGHDDSCGSNSQANLSQDMDGSLLDLADELGEGVASTSSLHSGSSRRGHTLGGGGYRSTGKYSPQNGYNSQTLPSAFHKRHSSEATSPEHSPHQVDFHPSSASGSSPFLPGSSQTSGRDHKQKSGKNIVRSWVQEQQFRAYQSSPSQVSLESNQSSLDRSPNLKAHMHQQPSPDFKTSPQGRQLHSSAEFKPGQFQPSPTNQRGCQASPGSSRSSSSLPRGNNSSSSLQREREAEKQRLRTLSLENKGVLQLAPQEFSSRGGSRVMQQFNEAIQADEHLRSHNSYPFSQEHAQQRAHDQHKWSSHGGGGPGYHQISHKQQQRSHDQWQGSHDQRQRSHDNTSQSLQQHHKLKQRQEVIDSSDYPLPNSPAPPPYKSPSPDSEQAQKLQQLNSRQPQPKPQFVYHAGALGMVEEQQFTRLDDDISTASKTVEKPQHKPLQSQPVGRGNPRVTQEPRRQASEGDILLSRQQQQQQHAQGHTLTIHVSSTPTFQEQASAMPPPSKTTESHTDQLEPQKSSSKDRPSTPDIIKELEDLMGGVEAMVTSSDFSAEDAAADQKARETTERRNELHPGSHQEEAPADGDSQRGAKKLAVQDVVKEDRLPSPLISPPQTPQESQTSTETHSSRRVSEERNRSMLSPSSSQAISPDQGDDIIDPPTPWRNNIDSPPMSGGFSVPEDNLAGILQEVMTTNNLPPPPAHLMALSQELEGYGQELRGTDSPDGETRPSQRGVPSIATTSLSSPRHDTHKEAPPTGGDVPSTSTASSSQGAKFDPKMFSRKKVEVPLAYENVRHGSTSLPPEIANFMSRVRNASIDNSDGSFRSDGGKIASSKSPSRAPDISGRQGISVPKEEEKVICSKEEASLYDTLGKPGELKTEATDSGEQTREQPTLAFEERGGFRSDGRFPSTMGDAPQSPNEDSVWFEKPQVSPAHQQPELSSSQVPQSHAKATSLPRGQVSDFSHFSSRHQQQHRSESMSSSHGSAHHARSDMVAPVHPKEGGQLPSANQSFWSKQPQPKQQQQQQLRLGEANVAEAEDPLPKPPQDGRRAQTFSCTARPVLKSVGASHLHHRMITPVTSEDVDPDSLPNSPTYFAQIQQQEGRETPSPGTQIENRSFQEYLNTLDAQSRMKKKKVVEWIQRSNIRQWEKDHHIKTEEGPPEKLRLDADTNVPAKPYQKQEPIYATADDPEPKTGVKLMEPNRSRTEPDGARMERQHHHRMEPYNHGRPPMEQGAGNSWGSGMEPFSQVRDRTRTEPSSNWGSRYENEGYRMEPGSHDRPRMQSETGGRIRTEHNHHNRPRMEAGGHNQNWNGGYGAQQKARPSHEWRNPLPDPRYGMDNRTRLATVSGSNPASSQFRYPPSAQQIPRSQASGASRGNQRSAGNRHQSIDPKAKFGNDYYVLDV